MRQSSTIILCTAIAAAVSLIARADLSTNLLAIADTSLFETDTNSNLGATVDIPAGTTAGGLKNRALFKFDLTQMPTNATITSAALKIIVTRKNFSGVGSTFDLHRVLQDWGEGVGSGNTGSPANPGEATWINRFHPSTPWSSPGAAAPVDYIDAASSSLFIDAVAPYTFSSTAALVADVQAWVNAPGTNFGWILISQSEGIAETSRRIASRSDTSNAPVLSISYTVPTPPPPPTPPTISQIALVGGQFQFSFNAESNRTYAVEFRAALNISSWATLTNFPAQPTPTNLDVTDPITDASRFYRVRTP